MRQFALTAEVSLKRGSNKTSVEELLQMTKDRLMERAIAEFPDGLHKPRFIITKEDDTFLMEEDIFDPEDEEYEEALAFREKYQTYRVALKFAA